MSQSNRPYNRGTCCWNCQAPGHTASQCSRQKRLFCSFCRKEGITTRDCKCRSKTYRINPPPVFTDIKQYPECPLQLPLIAVPIWVSVGNETFRSFINTSQVHTVVGWMVATKASLHYKVKREFIRSDTEIISEALIPLRIQNTIRAIRCRVTDQPDDQIILGLNAMNCFGCKFTIGTTTAIDFPGCAPINHQSVFGIALAKEIEETPISSQATLDPKDPITLKAEDPSTKKEPTAAIHDISTMKWSELDFADMGSEAQELAAVLHDSELEDYLRLDADLNDIQKLE